jgi:hypothetical protein
MQEKSTVIIFGVPSVLFILVVGLLLLKEPKNKISKQEK